MTYDEVVKEYKRGIFEILVEAPRGACAIPRFLMRDLKAILTSYGVKDRVRTSTQVEITSLLIACGYTDNGGGKYVK